MRCANYIAGSRNDKPREISRFGKLIPIMNMRKTARHEKFASLSHEFFVVFEKISHVTDLRFSIVVFVDVS